MEKSYILALDQGTSSSRAIVFDKNSNIISSSSELFPQYYPQNAWVEHNPMEIWASQMAALTKTLEIANISYKQIKAIGISNQRETTIVWDKHTGKPIYNAIVWQCRRTAKYCEHLLDSGYSDFVRKKTGLIIDSYFSASKIAWILDNVEGAREKALNGDLLFGTVDTWILWKMSKNKVHKTDHSNASRTMLYNIHDKAWDDELLKLFNIPKSILPTVEQSSSFFDIADEQYIKGQIPITAMAGDQQASLFGQLCINAGDIKNTYGTGCFTLLNTADKAIYSQNGLLTSLAASYNNKVDFVLEGSVFIAGSIVKWLRDELQIINEASETEEIALSVPNNHGTYFVPAFVGLGAPHWNPNARGTIIGLTQDTKKEHIIRAALESMAYQTMDTLYAMSEDSSIDFTSLKVDGGASENNFILQFQADIINKKIVRSKNTESTALGVAYLAGLEIGYWNNIEEILKLNKEADVFTPKMDNVLREKYKKEWKKAVSRSLDWL